MSKKLPQGWESVKLGKLFDIKKGKKVIQLDQKNEDSIRCIQIEDLRNNDFIKYCDNDPKHLIAIESDILIAWDGANAGTIGYGISGAVGSTLAILRCKEDKILTPYVARFLQGKFDYLRATCTGATIPHISRQALEGLSIPIPPLEEQAKIVSILEKAEKAIQKREESDRLLDELVKSRFIEMFGDPVSNPNEWEIKSFNEVFDISSSSRILKSEWKSEGIPFYRVRDMVKLSECGVADNEFFVSEEFYSSLSSSKGTPQVGDIMVSATSTIGKCYVVKENERFYYKDADVLRFRKKIELSAKYFIHFMKTQFAINQIKSTFGVTTVPHFTIVNAKKINMPYPPFELQNEFAGFVNLVDQLKFKMENSLKELENNFNSLMQKAFKGEL
ncbi:restriction endonuclease subunit S [Paraclostridium sordellii]|uniref:restriction endonuclease subunit S n=1 Tax=Paraclostridium sordellii TaxID=1505 RepID=UPI0005DC4369|nr:restriction endonuclease subunit S [Paeniclostridium sordellii]CEP84223.1 restriction modification system DNA specificity domain-containing protein [[Clostridium] sordellii] [Paeniclostridium sordellii]